LIDEFLLVAIQQGVAIVLEKSGIQLQKNIPFFFVANTNKNFVAAMEKNGGGRKTGV
jgi:hypothetical protein